MGQRTLIASSTRALTAWGNVVYVLWTVMVLPLTLPRSAPDDCKRHDHDGQLKVVLQVLVNTWEKIRM